MNRLSRHGPLVAVGDGIWCMSADTEDLERPRRMTLVAAPGHGLVVHSGIRLPDSELEQLHRLGPLSTYLLVANPFHDPDCGWFAGRYRAMRMLCAASAVVEFQRRARVDGTIEHDWPAELSGVLEAHVVAGLRFSETVLFHRSSRSLVVVDLAFNMTRPLFVGKPLGRLLMQLNRGYDRFGMTRLTELLVKDRAALAGSLRTVLAWNFERIIVSHGEIIEREGRQVFEEAFSRFLG